MARASPLPSFGSWVTFTHWHNKPTAAEVEAYGRELDELSGVIGYKRRPNETPNRPALVIGVKTVKAEAPVLWNGGNWFAAWQDKRLPNGDLPPLRTFYEVRYGLRSRVYLVDPADLQPIKQRRVAG